jgi:hypothetical protein
VKKLLLVFNTVEEAGNYIIENLINSGKEFTYRAVGTVGMGPEVEIINVDNDTVKEILCRPEPPAPGPDFFMCENCDHFLGEIEHCSHHDRPTGINNTCPSHAYAGVLHGTTYKEDSDDWTNPVEYSVRIFPDQTAACTCKAFQYRPAQRPCKHIDRVRHHIETSNFMKGRGYK